VCHACGSVDECSHDLDDMDIIPENTRMAQTLLHSRIPTRQQNHHDTEAFEMRSNAPILPHSEIFNTYGETLTNAQLLAQYGFVLDANENDCITWEINELYDFAAAQSMPRSESADHGHLDCLMEVWRGIVQIWPDDAGWIDSGLVYSPSKTNLAGTDSNLFEADNGHHGIALELNSDARIAHQLWLYCALLGMEHVEVESGRELFGADALLGPELDNTVGFLRKVADLQMGIEVGLDEDGGVNISDKETMLPDGSIADRDRPSSRLPMDVKRDRSGQQEMLLSVLSRTAHTVVSLCDSRKSYIGKKGADCKSIHELGEFVDVSRAVGRNIVRRMLLIVARHVVILSPSVAVSDNSHFGMGWLLTIFQYRHSPTT
jgi:N-lysine methyltransferase SETD6